MNTPTPKTKHPKTTDEVKDSRFCRTFWLDNEIVYDYLPTIGLHAFAVYTVLACHAGASRSCFPAVGTIAKELGVSKPTVRKAIATLKDAGLISVETQKTPTKNGKEINRVNVYSLLPIKEGGGKPRYLPLEGGVGNDVDQGGKRGYPGVGNDVDPNKESSEKGSGKKEEENSLGVPNEFPHIANAQCGAPVEAIAESVASEPAEPATPAPESTQSLMESERPPKPPVPPPPFPPVVGQPVVWRHYKLADGQWLYETPALVKAVGEFGVKVAYQDDDGHLTMVFTDACQLSPRDGTPDDAKLLAYRNGCNGHTLPLPVAPVKVPTPTLPPLGDAPAGYRWVTSANSTQRHIAHLSKASLERPRALCKEALGAEGLLRDGEVTACVECLKAVAKPPTRPSTSPGKPKLVQPPADVKDAIANLCYGGTDLIPVDWRLIVKFWNQLECPPLAKIEKFGRWWKACDWRGQKGDKPTIILLRSLWSTAQNWDGVTVPVRPTSLYRSNGDPDDNQAILDRSLAKMQAERAAKEAQLHGNG